MRARAIGNHNKLLGRVKGVDGIKTGYTRASGFNLMTNGEDRRPAHRRGRARRPVGRQPRPDRDRARPHVPAARLRRRSHVLDGCGRQPGPARSGGERRRGRRRCRRDAGRAPEPARGRSHSGAGAAVASAAGASSTTTPSPTPRGSAVAAALPPAAQAFASAQRGKIDHRLPGLSETAAVRHEAPAPAARPGGRRRAAARAGPSCGLGVGHPARRRGRRERGQDPAPGRQARSGRALAQASAFTVKVVRDGSTLYRARFSGFDRRGGTGGLPDLKRSGFNCFATRS